MSQTLVSSVDVDVDSMPQFPAASQLDSSFTAYQKPPVALSTLKKKKLIHGSAACNYANEHLYLCYMVNAL